MLLQVLDDLPKIALGGNHVPGPVPALQNVVGRWAVLQNGLVLAPGFQREERTVPFLLAVGTPPDFSDPSFLKVENKGVNLVLELDPVLILLLLTIDTSLLLPGLDEDSLPHPDDVSRRNVAERIQLLEETLERGTFRIEALGAFWFDWILESR